MRKPVIAGNWKMNMTCTEATEYMRVLIPLLKDIPKKGREDIKITAVESVDEVLKIALKNELKRVEWTEVENISEANKDQKSQASIQ